MMSGIRGKNTDPELQIRRALHAKGFRYRLHATGVPGNTPGRIRLWRGDARTLAWKRERVLLEFPRVDGDPNGDFGYPWLLHDGGARWRMFYYHGRSRGACAVWMTEVDLR